MSVLRPAADEQAPAIHAQELHDEEIVARGNPGTAVRDDVPGSFNSCGPKVFNQLSRLGKSSIRLQVLATGNTHSPRNMAWPGIYRVLFALEPVTVAGIDNKGTFGRRFLDVSQELGRPRTRGEIIRVTAGDSGLELPLVAVDSTIQDGRRVPKAPQHPYEASGNHAARVIVGNHHVIITDASPAHALGKYSRVGQGIPAPLGRSRP